MRLRVQIHGYVKFVPTDNAGGRMKQVHLTAVRLWIEGFLDAERSHVAVVQNGLRPVVPELHRERGAPVVMRARGAIQPRFLHVYSVTSSA